jgi:hypothetical protein
LNEEFQIVLFERKKEENKKKNNNNFLIKNEKIGHFLVNFDF